ARYGAVMPAGHPCEGSIHQTPSCSSGSQPPDAFDRDLTEFVLVPASETGVMGKVRDEVSASRPSKPSKGKSGGAPRGLFVQFLLNRAGSYLFKPMQGWYARLYTALGLGLIGAAGAWRVYEASLDAPPHWRIGLPAAFAVALGWIIFRIVHFPPFAE